jgi:hypothetical protein
MSASTVDKDLLGSTIAIVMSEIVAHGVLDRLLPLENRNRLHFNIAYQAFPYLH